MNETRILGIHITDRVKDSLRVQEILTKFGCSIKTRLGLSDVLHVTCSSCGLILLELTGDPAEADKLELELGKVENLDVQKMVFKG